MNEIEEPAKRNEIEGSQEQQNFLFSEYYNTQYSITLNTEKSNKNEAVNINLKNGFIGKPGFIAKALPLTKGLKKGKLTINTIDFKCSKSLPSKRNSYNPNYNEKEIFENNELSDIYLKIIPNPASDIVTVSSSEIIKQVILYDMKDHIHCRKSDIDACETILPLDECMGGIYIVVIIDEKGKTYKQRLIVNK